MLKNLQNGLDLDINIVKSEVEQDSYIQPLATPPPTPCHSFNVHKNRGLLVTGGGKGVGYESLK